MLYIITSPSTGEQAHQYASYYVAPNTYTFKGHECTQGKSKQKGKKIQQKKKAKKKDKQARNRTLIHPSKMAKFYKGKDKIR